MQKLHILELVLLTGAPLDTEQPGPLGHTEAPYSRVGSIERDTRDTEQPGLPGYPGQIGEGGLSGS